MGSPYVPLPRQDTSDWFETLGQAYNNQSVKQEMQYRGQQMQENELKLQQQRQAAADDAALRQAYRDSYNHDGNGNFTFDQGGFENRVRQTAPTLYPGVVKNRMDVQKQQGELLKTDLENQQKNLVLGGQIVNGITDQTSYSRAVAQLEQLGLLHPGSAPPIYDPKAVPGFVQSLQQAALTTDQYLSHLHQQADLDERSQHDAAAEQNTAWERDETQRFHDLENKHWSQQSAIELGRLRMEQQKNSFDQNGALEQQAQQIASGDVKAPSLSRNNPYNRAVMARVYEINPSYSDSLYTMTQDLRSSKPNSMGANVGRLGTGILHADRALQNSGDLGFSEGLLTGVGTEGTAKYKQDAEFLAGEIGQFVIGGKLTKAEGDKLTSNLYSSRQSVRDSAIKEVIGLSAGKLKSQMEQYRNATQNDFPTDRVFNDPEIKGALQKHGVIGDAQPATHWSKQSPAEASAKSSTGSGSRRFNVNGINYNIPADKVDEFLKDHPNAR